MQLQRRTASRGGSHFLMFRLPWSLAPQVAPTAQVLLPAGSRGVYPTQWTESHLPELWYRYMTESDNCHGGSFTRWTAALSAATLALAVKPFEQDFSSAMDIVGTPFQVIRYGVITQVAQHSYPCLPEHLRLRHPLRSPCWLPVCRSRLADYPHHKCGGTGS